MELPLEKKQSLAATWFKELRDNICAEFEKIEAEYSGNPGKFQRKLWQRRGGGGGEISLLKGAVFEKVGVNISTVFGQFSNEFAKEIPGSLEGGGNFWASGISLVAHMRSPLVPAVHMNTRFICTTKQWFGGGSDLTPIYPDAKDTNDFHSALKNCCDKHGEGYYAKFKKHCDEYFYLKHRDEPRGVGGIFYDYLDGGWQKDFEFTQDVGKTFLDIYPKIIRRNMNKKWSEEQRAYQLQKRGRYVEFNLLYDRGTKFGLMTGGNVDAILMSLPPLAGWE